MKSIIVTEGAALIPIGKQGENNAVPILFKVSAWTNKYGEGGTFALSHKRATDSVPYPATITLTDDGVLWLITAADNAIEGYGECELKYVLGDVIKKSVTWKTYTSKALAPVGDTPPDPYESWYEQILEASEEAQKAAERAETASGHQPYPNTETGTWWVWDGEINAYKDTGVFYGASTYVHSQGVASNTWTINHNLGKYPSVTVTDSTGRIVVGGVQYVDANTVILTFSGAFSGTAYLN